jgi:hypothetical protein
VRSRWVNGSDVEDAVVLHYGGFFMNYLTDFNLRDLPQSAEAEAAYVLARPSLASQFDADMRSDPTFSEIFAAVDRLWETPRPGTEAVHGKGVWRETWRIAGEENLVSPHDGKTHRALVIERRLERPDKDLIRRSWFSKVNGLPLRRWNNMGRAEYTEELAKVRE